MTQKTALHIIALFFVTAVISFLLFKNGFPIGYDYKNLIISYEAVSTQMQEGEVYPRWLEDVNKGYGGTNLFFYPPLIYYSGFLIDVITGFNLSTQTILSLNAFLLILLSGLSFYVFARGMATPNLSVLASIVYITLPYHTWFEIYERNALAELSSYVWIPLIFHCIRSDLIKKPKYSAGLSISYALLILSHLPTAVFSSIFIVIYCGLKIISVEIPKERLRYGLTLLMCFVLGAGISGLYLYPAISLLEHTNSEYLWGGFYEYKNWFLWFNNDCPIKGACTNMFTIALVQIIIPASFFILLILKEKKKYDRESVYFILLAVLCFFLMTPFSVLLWDALPPLQKIQFPWRLLVISDFLFAALLLSTSSCIYNISEGGKAALYVLIGLMVLSICTLNISIATYVQNSWTPSLHKFEDSIANKMLTEEHIPKNKNLTLSYKELQQSTPVPLWTITLGESNIELLTKKPRLIELHVTAQKAFTLQVRQFYFLGWRVIRDDEDITQRANLRDAKPYGQLEMDLPKGNYSIKIKLETLLKEKIGVAISIMSLLLLLAFIFTAPYLENRSKNP